MLSTAMNDGMVTAAEGLTEALAVLGTLGITYMAPNRQADDQS